MGTFISQRGKNGLIGNRSCATYLKMLQLSNYLSNETRTTKVAKSVKQFTNQSVELKICTKNIFSIKRKCLWSNYFLARCLFVTPFLLAPTFNSRFWDSGTPRESLGLEAPISGKSLVQITSKIFQIWHMGAKKGRFCLRWREFPQCDPG